MSFWDNVKKFAQPYGDDDYDDYDDEEYIDDYEQEPARRAPSRRSAPVSAPPVEDDVMDDVDFGFETAPSTPAASAASTPSGGFSGRVVNMSSSAKHRIFLFRPQEFNETSKAADELRANKAVILNLENVDNAMALRVVDFLTGCTYALDGTLKKVAQNAYLFCPHNMEIVGNLEALQAEIESYI